MKVHVYEPAMQHPITGMRSAMYLRSLRDDQQTWSRLKANFECTQKMNRFLKPNKRHH